MNRGSVRRDPSFSKSKDISVMSNINILLHRSSLPALPSYDSLSLLWQSLANLIFSDKIHKLHNSLLIVFLPLLTFRLLLLHITFHPSPVLPLMRFLNSSLTLLTLISDLDPIPTSLLKQFSHILYFSLSLTSSICFSLLTSIFPDQFKNCSIHPHIKNLT